ncbi:uncharacterized protein K444DRAFT_646709 [Hyaloscypha bicolor E]|uniref:NmrA-like domain-containing protein n=1 Tax=Hyaloscypha bicolor E TaxID=1095630 RepID=A0A2J6SRZ6_9HELO|nr:uncharacterized protein K444DRAFT_646709 [Hyaloscypha bicolor E]PMD53509.1 hypothetical protein K444DRAFT_646709 [Hyaloscypha bicolor E]
MSSQKVLPGATGETGALSLIAFPNLAYSGVKILIADISSPIEELATLLKGVYVFISAISRMALMEQVSVVMAAKEAGVKRFVPCGFATVCPAGGVNRVMRLRDQASVLRYPFTDVGYWYPFSFPHLPSGKIDDFTFPKMYSKMRGDGTALNLITDLRDVGDFVARIVGDGRTLNKYDIYGSMEDVSGEKLERKFQRSQGKEMEEEVLEARKLFKEELENRKALGRVVSAEYEFSKYVRMDNRAVFARYLGYLDAREAYPDFQPRKFRVL